MYTRNLPDSDHIAGCIEVIVTVALMHHRKSDFDRFEGHIRELDEVAECVATGGGMDYVMKVFSPSLADFQALMESLLVADIGIDRYMTYIVTRRMVRSWRVNAKIGMSDRIPDIHNVVDPDSVSAMIALTSR